MSSLYVCLYMYLSVVVCLYKDQLKDQKVAKQKKKKRRSGAGPQKMAKTQTLPLSFWKAMFTGLKPSLQEEVIDGVLDMSLSIAEAKVEVQGKYVLQRTMEHITEQLHLKSWKEVTDEFTDRVSLRALQQVCSRYSAKKMIGGMTRKEKNEYGRIESVSIHLFSYMVVNPL